MFENAKCLLLHTKEGRDCLYKQSNKLYYHKGYLTQDYLNNSLNAESFHLYILSSDKIEEGDWFLVEKNIYKLAANEYYYNIDGAVGHGFGFIGYKEAMKIAKKIIATTDKSLYNNEVKLVEGSDNNKYPMPDILPKPSDSLIQAYIESYNNDNAITNISIEYIDNGEEEWDEKTEQPYWKERMELKVDKNNTITIKKLVEKTYTEEQMRSLTYSSFFIGIQSQTQISNKSPLTLYNEWIKENL